LSVLAEYERYDGLGLAELVRKREVTAAEVLEETIARIEARNPAVNAVITKMYDEARKAIASGLPDGPFTGVPYLLKDIGVSRQEAVRECAKWFWQDEWSTPASGDPAARRAWSHPP